jgi:hypothetical protein
LYDVSEPVTPCGGSRRRRGIRGEGFGESAARVGLPRVKILLKIAYGIVRAEHEPNGARRNARFANPEAELQNADPYAAKPGRSVGASLGAVQLRGLRFSGS